MTLGIDDYLFDIPDQELRGCDKCGRGLDDYYYATPEGDFCWECAWSLAYDYVRGDAPDLETETDEFEELVLDYMEDWKMSHDYEY